MHFRAEIPTRQLTHARAGKRDASMKARVHAGIIEEACLVNFRTLGNQSLKKPIGCEVRVLSVVEPNFPLSEAPIRS